MVYFIDHPSINGWFGGTYFRKSPYVSICVSLLINMVIYQYWYSWGHLLEWIFREPYDYGNHQMTINDGEMMGIESTTLRCWEYTWKPFPKNNVLGWGSQGCKNYYVMYTVYIYIYWNNMYIYIYIFHFQSIPIFLKNKWIFIIFLLYFCFFANKKCN